MLKRAFRGKHFRPASVAGGCAGKMVAGVNGSIHCREDVARLTAALTRASLPMHYRVVLDSERAAQ